MVIRLKASSSVGATASEIMLKPLRAKSADTLASTPARFSTIMEIVWWRRRPLPDAQAVPVLVSDITAPPFPRLAAATGGR